MRVRSTFLPVLLLLLPGLCTAQGSELDKSNRPLVPREVSGIVTGQMLTVMGKAFYDTFAAAWNEKDANGRFNLFVVERPNARWGSQIFILYGNKLMFRSFLPPNRSKADGMAQQAAEDVFASVIQTQVDQVFGDADLARDEL